MAQFTYGLSRHSPIVAHKVRHEWVFWHRVPVNIFSGKYIRSRQYKSAMSPTRSNLTISSLTWDLTTKTCLGFPGLSADFRNRCCGAPGGRSRRSSGTPEGCSAPASRTWRFLSVDWALFCNSTTSYSGPEKIRVVRVPLRPVHEGPELVDLYKSEDPQDGLESEREVQKVEG